jgi:diguanylate cyclase (GGDEF)-like protein
MRSAAAATPSKRLMAYTAAAMYGGAAFVGLLEGAIPGGQRFSLLPALGALVVVIPLLFVGPRLPLPALAALGPIGAALIAASLATTEGHGDGAVLYMWPVLWTSYFFGRRGTILIVAWIGVVDALALASMSSGPAGIDRWLDVMVTVGIVAAVVDYLAEHNRKLVVGLSAEARVDKLTGVLNRRGFDERVEVELEHSRREGGSVAVVSFDLDHFKRVNDDWGHDAGDRVLARLGSVLQGQSRGTDVVARLGGEEFAALLPGSGLDGARDYAERVRAEFSAGRDRGLDLPRLTVSAGVVAAVAPEHSEVLLHAADSALYAAKRAGRDRTCVYGLLGAAAAEPAAEASDGEPLALPGGSR